MLLLAALGAMLLAGAADLLQLVMAVLLSSVTGYILAAYHRSWPLSVEAGMKYFLVGALTNTLLMIGVTLLFGLFGALETRPDVIQSLIGIRVQGQLLGALPYVMTVIILAGFVGKAIPPRAGGEPYVKER